MKTFYRGSYKNKRSIMKNLSFSTKRNITVAAFSLRMICMGIEFAVIFPSVWLYLKIFHVDYWYLGLVLSAYNMVGIVSTVLVGRLADATRKIRLTGFIWNLTEIAGNIIYALHFNVAFPLIGRMVAGFGEGYISAMWGEIARVTTKEQRTRYFAILKGSNLFGAAIGPAFNLFLKEFNFYIGEWHIDFRTSPGFFMGIVWVLVTFIMLQFVYDLSTEMGKKTEYQPLPQEKHDIQTVGSFLSGSITPQQPLGEHGPSNDNEDVTKTKEKIQQETTPTFKDAMMDMFKKYEVNVLVYLLFFMYVMHTCLQGITPLIAERMLKWDETKVSILYTVWGLEIIAVLIVVWVVSPKISDRIMLLLSSICSNLAAISFVVLSYSGQQSDLTYYSFLFAILLEGVGISITVVVGRSLVSKHTCSENQGLVHAILTSFNRLAGLTGPIFGSSLYSHKTIMGFFIGAVQFVGLILLLTAFRRLKPSKKS